MDTNRKQCFKIIVTSKVSDVIRATIITYMKNSILPHSAPPTGPYLTLTEPKPEDYLRVLLILFSAFYG